MFIQIHFISLQRNQKANIMKSIRVTHPNFNVKIMATIYSHEDTEEIAVSVAKRISGGFIKKNNTTGFWTVFYPATCADVANKF